MTDKEILDEVYRRLCFIDGNFKGMDNTLETHSVRSFIEQEWQKEDNNLTAENSTIGFKCPKGPTGEKARTQTLNGNSTPRSFKKRNFNNGQ